MEERLVFIVDDEENIREIVRCALESCGIAVRGFEDAVRMLEAAKKEIPGLILLDIMLPHMDGYETLRKLKQDPDTADVPVIMLTAKGAETDKVMGLDLGADDYIVKPFGVLEMMARVRAALRRGSTSHDSSDTKSHALEHKGILLDFESHEVSQNGEKLELTLKEYELLKILMENTGRVMTRNNLLDNVWGYSYIGETRTLDMHIRSLRQKLNDDTGNGGFISTVRGVGYRFNS